MKIFKKPFKKPHFGGGSTSGGGAAAVGPDPAAARSGGGDLPPPSPSAVSPTAEAVRPSAPAVDRTDYYSSEEEFQVQLALALSASNSDVSGDPDGDQIRAATLLSLGAHRIGRERDEEGIAEALSRRYWDYNVLDYNEKVIDGFYDIFGHSSNSAGQGKMPALVDLQTGIGDLGFEVIVVNRAIDPQLVELEQISHCISLDYPAAQVAVLVQRVSELITEHMGGPVRDANDMLARWMEKSTELRTSQQTSLLPIGCIKIGLSRHRALLFKVLADNIGIPCRLVKGSHFTGVDDDAVNIIKLDNEREFLVDLMAAPGTLIPADVFSTKDAPLGSFNSRMNKSLIPSTTSNSGDGLCNSLEPSYGDYKGTTSNSGDSLLSLEPSYEGNNGNFGTFGLDNNSVSDKRSRYEKVALGPSIPNAHSGTLLTNAGSSSNVNMSMCLLDQTNQSSSPTTATSSKQKGVLKVPGDGANVMNGKLNIASNSAAESRELFSELDPFQLVGVGKPSAPVSSYKNTEYQRRRENIPSGPGRPQLPLVWKNRSPCNEVLNAKQSNNVDGFYPRKNVGIKDLNMPSSSHQSSVTGKFYSDVPNVKGTSLSSTSYSTEVGTSGSEMNDASTRNIGRPTPGANSSGIHGTNQQRKLDNSYALIPIQSSEEKTKEESRTNGLGLQNNMVNESKEQRRIVKGKHDRNKFTYGVMGPNLVSKDSKSSSSPLQSMPSRLDPMLDDVAECEIPWEDLVIGERIGLGSYGEVYRADWNGTEVAVKKFLDQDFYGDALDEFRSEVRIMRRLRHPNVVLFMGAVTRPPNLSIVSEYLPRGSLYRILHRSNCQTDEKQRIRMALDVAKGMNCLHTSIPTVVHRDLKSPNLLVDKNWTVKVCDFGLSRLKHSTFLSSKSTAGTPEWMAPEVLRNEPSNEKCDVYSFGVILWELATLRMPWSGMNPMQVVGAVGFQERRLNIPKEVDPIVARIIWECWQTDPSLRPSFAQLTTALKSLQRLIIPNYQDIQNPALPQEISVNSTP